MSILRTSTGVCNDVTLLWLVLQELKLKDDECKKLSRFRQQMSEEIEELTASLFEVSQGHTPMTVIVYSRRVNVTEKVRVRIDAERVDIILLCAYVCYMVMAEFDHICYTLGWQHQLITPHSPNHP